MKKFLLTLLFLLFTVNVYSLDRFVDRDASCSGDNGDTGTPWCTIQDAFTNAAPGHVIKIRDSASCYDENAILTISGTASNRISIQPDSGHNPCIRETGTSLTTGAIDIRASYVTVQNLTFNGADISPVRYALVMSAMTADITDVIFTGNTVLNWGSGITCVAPNCDRRFVSIGAQISSTFWVRNGQITNNTITDGRARGISVGHTDAMLIQGNVITGLKCGFQSTNNSGAQGIKVGDDGTNNIVRANFVSDHSLSCSGITTGTGTPLFVGLYCDTGPTGTLIEWNTVHDIVPSGSATQDGVGIFNESRCHNSTIRNNLVYNIGRYGLRNGSPSTSDPNDSIWVHNTVYNVSISPSSGGAAFWLRRGFRATIQNNILATSSTGTIPIDVHATAVSEGGHTINGNLYWDSVSGSKVGRWSTTTNNNISAWRTACGCDANSPNPFAPPVTSASNLTITSLTNMAGVTTNPVLPKNGDDPIIGAYDPPRANAGNAITTDTTHVTLTLVNNKYPNIVCSNCATGMTGSPETISSATVSGQIITFTYGVAHDSGDTITLTYVSGTGNITDNAPFTNKQKLLSFTNLAVANTLAGGGSTATLTQSNFQFYGLRTVGGLIVKLPHSASPVNTNVKAIPGAKFIVNIQIDGSTADTTAATYSPYVSFNGGAYAVSTDSFTDNLRYLGVADASTDIPTSGGYPLTSCLAGGNTPITGSIQRTSAEIPTVTITDGGCFTIGFIFELDTDISAGDTWEFRMRKGATVLDTYSVTPKVTAIGRQAGF